MKNNSYGSEFWDQRYSSDSYLYGEAPNDFLVENINHLKPGGRVLSLSEGEGRNAVYLASVGFQVTGVDMSSVAREKALKLATKNKVELNYELANVDQFDLGVDKWDAIVSIFGHTPSAVRLKLHQKIKRALRKGGVIILEGYNEGQLKYNTGGPKDADMLYNKDQLAQDFKDMTILLLQDKIRKVVEGTAHHGDASVTQLIAVK